MKETKIMNRTGTAYELIDFGDGRKLERFGDRLIDRPSPAALGVARKRSSHWKTADSVFLSEGKRWEHRTPWPPNCEIRLPHFGMPIGPTPFGHIGVFPEQTANWDWLIETAAPSDSIPEKTAIGDRAKALNLFAYTGASTIAMAVSGMAVAHVDAAKPNVAVARRAAEINSLQNHPIRYLVDDAVKFAAREVRRGNRYHTIVMDPPAYGHAPSGKAWRIERDLWPLLDHCRQLLDPDGFRLLITGHSPQVRAADVIDYLEQESADLFRPDRKDLATCFQSGRLTLADSSRRKLDAGFFVRCEFPPRIR